MDEDDEPSPCAEVRPSEATRCEDDPVRGRAGGDARMPMLLIAEQNLPFILRLKYGPPDRLGPSPRLRRWFGYSSPDDWYEAAVAGLVTATTTWLDVGCGRNVFPSNRAAAKLLAERCRLLVGIDPSDNIHANDIIHERAQCVLEDYVTDRRFDLVTLRMVAEHITDPVGTVRALARLTSAGGRVVIYTVSKWSPVTVVSAITPFRFHVAAKRFLWRTDERDTFPTAYRMNTRRELRRLFAAGGFLEESFYHLDDCMSFGRFLWLSRLELLAWRTLRSVGLRYPEASILAVFRNLG
jgi:SAM-dependent methyltransferase